MQGINWIGFLWKNLIPVTLGNIVGGVLFVAVAYWSAYLRPSVRKLVEVTGKKEGQNIRTLGDRDAKPQVM